MQQKRSLRIDVFDNFRKAMLNYFSLYKEDDGEKKKKSTTSHRIALALAKQFPSTCKVEIDYMGVDIVIKRGDDIILLLFWSNSYLTEKDKERAREAHNEKMPLLTLAFSLLEDRNYLLVYRFEKEYLEYLHIDKSDFSEEVLKRSEDKGHGDNGQLMLTLKGKAPSRKRRKKTKKVNEEIEEQ